MDVNECYWVYKPTHIPRGSHLLLTPPFLRGNHFQTSHYRIHSPSVDERFVPFLLLAESRPHPARKRIITVESSTNTHVTPQLSPTEHPEKSDKTAIARGKF
jgi:hypothetical protein